MYQISTPPVDPVIHHQWLEFENRRLKASGDEFQRLFEDIMVRSQPGFMRIRPYGNIGDRKCDGLFQAGSTLYQVYSPDELKQADLVKKIDEDLDGAIQSWGDEIQKWIFVYNVKRGLPPDIPSALTSKREQHPNITIESLSNDQLWEITRNLTAEQRTELFGAPSFSHHSVDRQSWLNIALQRSRERCISRWQSIGVPRDKAVNLADDYSIGSPPSNLILSPGQLVILIGEMGVGKSLAGDRCFQSLIHAERENHLKQTPLFLEASRLQEKGLEDVVRESLQGVCNPDNDRTVIIVDSIDTTGITNSNKLIGEARILVGLWKQSTILLISKPTLEFNSAEESIDLPLLSEDEAESLVKQLTNLQNFSIKILPQILQEAILRPLYAILLGTYIKENGVWKLQSKQQLIADLVERSLRPLRENIVRASQLLEQLAANCLDKGGSSVLSNEITAWTERQQLLDSNLITETNDKLQFPIPILTQWFGSQYLLKNKLDLSFFAGNKKRLELWQAPLAIAVATFPLKRVSEILIPIVEYDPIAGANIVSEALAFQCHSMEAPSQSPLELAKQIRTATQAWIKGFKFLASSIAPHFAGAQLPTIGVRIGERQLEEEENSMSKPRMTAWIEVAWHVGDTDMPASVELPTNVSNDDLSSTGWKSICGFPPYLLTSWVWQWTLEQAVDLLLKPRSIPVKQGLLSLEASWHATSIILKRNYQDPNPIPLEVLTNRLSGVEGFRCSDMMHHCFDQLSVEINCATSKGLKYLRLPDSFQSFRNNHTHSAEDLLAYAKDVYHGAFEGYLRLVNSLSPLIPNLKLASILPAKLIGILALPDHSDEICITHYWEPLPVGSQNEIDFSLSDQPYSGEYSSVQATARRWMELRPQWWMDFKVQTSTVSMLTKFWLGANPVTELAYEFLWEDFKRMGWVHGDIGSSGFPYTN